MRRPLFLVAILYAGGVLLASRLSLSLCFLFGISGAVAVLALTCARARPILIWLLIPIVSWTMHEARTAVISPRDLRILIGHDPALVTLRGTLVETPTLRFYEQDQQPSWRTMARVEVAELQPNGKAWMPASGMVAVSTPGLLTNLFGGQTIEVTGVLELPRVASAEGTFDYRAYLLGQGIYYRLRAGSEKDWRIVAWSGPSLADRFREWGKQALARGLPAEDEALRLEWALTLGWKTALTEEVSEPFIQAATYHIFAVDGLRMAILFGIFFSLFRAVGFSRAVCGAILIPVIWFYVALTGWPASAIRATVMLTVVIVGWLLRRPTDLLNSLFAAALIILVWEPRQLFQAGFQLSFLVVLCIILLMPPLRAAWGRLWAADPLVPARLRPRWRRWFRVPGRYVSDLLLTSFAAWIGSIPLVAYYFNLVTPVSTPANIVAVPLCALVLMSNLASLLLAPWLPMLAQVFNQAGWFLMELIRVTSEWFAAWPKAYYYSEAPGLLTTLVYYVVLLALATGWLIRPRWRPMRWLAVGALILIWVGDWWAGASVKRLTILNLSGGYGIYCDFPGKSEDLLIDPGTTNAVQFLTKPFLRAQGVNRLSGLLLSHGDLHQIGGALMLERLFGAKQVLVGPLTFRSPAYRQTLRSFQNASKPVQVLSRGDSAAGWSVLHPDAADKFSVADDKALVLVRTIEGSRVLLLSDLGRRGQEVLMARELDLRADILVAGLPAKPEALGEALLDAIQPRLIVLCDSEFPASARAGKSLCERLARRGVQLVYTRFAGSVTLEFGKHSWQLRTMNSARLPPITSNPEPAPDPGPPDLRE